MTKKWQAIDPNIAFFPVALKPIFFEPSTIAMDSEQTDLFSSEFKQLQRHFAVVDESNNRVFSVVTDNYKLVTNKEAFDAAQSVMKQVFKVIKPQDLVCLNVTMPSTRSFCHIDLIHKNADFAPWEKDKWTAFLRITNSYNRTHLLRFELGFCRWVCLNGMIFGTKSVEFSYAHNKQGMDKVERFIENIGDIQKLEIELTEKLHQLKRYHVPEQYMLGLACKVFEFNVQPQTDIKPKRIEELIKFRDSVQHATKKYYNEMGAHGYAALNVLTDVATRPVSAFSAESKIDGMQRKCGSWIDAFVEDISKHTFSFDAYLAEYSLSAKLLQNLVAP